MTVQSALSTLAQLATALRAAIDPISVLTITSTAAAAILVTAGLTLLARRARR